MMTHPKILFCNIKLSPGEKAEYVYREKIPLANIPPTFRGGFVKYSYKLTIGTQRPDSAVSEIKIPFRVLTVDGMKEPSAYTDKQKVLAPSNPFLASDDNSSAEHSVRDIALQLLAEQSARKRNNCYNISNLHGKVARISLPKTSYKIGEDLSCTFDFSQATVQCLQVTVTLQSVEEVSERLKKEGERHTNTISHSNHQEFCLHMSRANIMLPIPLHITPSFNSDFVSLKWQLHIEFVTLTTHIPDQAPAESDTSSTLWHGVTDLDTETIHWHLPLTLLSTNPLQCGIIQSVKCDDLVQLD
ncbi:RGP1 [Bugula neritina]|uniref:RGP1 n=1 Tax=Bugula neritina TaxID=10212 RepID=A0A7J7JCI4_BUGNE|nr:RGP1 [Bugula neritina]